MTTETGLYVCKYAGPECGYGCKHSKPHKESEYDACSDMAGACSRIDFCICIPVPKEPEAGQEG